MKSFSIIFPLSLKKGKIEGELDFKTYSKYKYGDSNSINYFSEKINSFLKINSLTNCYFISSPFKLVKNSIYYISENILNINISLKNINIKRDTIYDGDYSKLAYHDRISVFKPVYYLTDNNILDFGKKVIVLDDVRITGLHESNISVFLELLGFTDITCLYISGFTKSLSGDDSKIEYRLNKYNFSKVSDFINFFDGTTKLSTRSIKMILGIKDRNIFEKIISRLSRDQLKIIYDAYMNEINGIEYSFNSNIIKNLIKNG